MEAFKRFFKVKTRREWEERKAWGGVDGCFVYTAPKAGEPAGEMETSYGFGDLAARGSRAGMYGAAMLPTDRLNGGAPKGGMNGFVAGAPAHYTADI